jgi:uncharacterized membrane protein YhaH (DUF805 family)
MSNLSWMTMPFRRYADFSGRSQRKEYWMFLLFNWVVALMWGAVIGIVMLALYFTDMSEDSMMLVCMILILPYAIYSLWVIVPGLAVTVRRLHDLDKSGWHLLIGLIPLVGGIILIVWYCTEGTRGPNRYGPDPLAGHAAPVFA